MPQDRIVSVGLLTEGDLQRLGAGFKRHFPVVRDDMFADLIARLDSVEIEPLGTSVVLRLDRTKEAHRKQ